MKKFVILLFMLLVCSLSVKAMSFSEAKSQTRPMAVLIYANWADDMQTILSKYDSMAAKYADKYNFTKIDIATEEAKEFNKTYHIYPNLPYVLLFKDKGKISRYLKKECVSDDACFKERLDFFAD